MYLHVVTVSHRCIVQLSYLLSLSLSDFAYVDSQQPDLPHHICIIRDFKLVSFYWVSQHTVYPECMYTYLRVAIENRDTGDV